MSPRASRDSASPTSNGRAVAQKPRQRPQPAGTAGDPKELLGYYRQMLLIRRFDEKAAEMYQRARIGGYCHLNLGEEATCVGLAAGM